MTYDFVGRSNLEVSRICLGTMHFGVSADRAESFRIMDAALEMGINFFDTANVYGRAAGPGATETIIGEWFDQGGGRRDRVVLATKVYGQMVSSPGPNEKKGISTYKIKKQVADSLRRLRTDHIDLYQVHHIDRRISGEEFWGTFENLHRNGDVSYFGTSNFPGWGLVKYQMIAEQRGDLGIVSEQTQYNLLSRYPELEVIPAAEQFGIGVMPYMPLAGGLLTGKKSAQSGSRTAEVESEYGLPISQNTQLAEFSRICAEVGEPEFIVAIAWVLANPAVYSAIVGIRSVKHLEGLDRAASLELPPEILDRLGKVFDINRGRALKPGPAPEAFAW
ncbi:MAG: aldo/keto reductase [Spirochaetaceae bacterium]|nr:MAG: aldo/keto reductase [Spirochaetaceae bacterium]